MRGRGFHPHGDGIAWPYRIGGRKYSGLELRRLTGKSPAATARRTLDQHCLSLADEPAIALRRNPLLQRDNFGQAPAFLFLVDRVAELERARVLAQRIFEAEGRVVAHPLHQIERGAEIRLFFSMEADDDVSRKRNRRYRRAHPLDQA